MEVESTDDSAGETESEPEVEPTSEKRPEVVTNSGIEPESCPDGYEVFRGECVEVDEVFDVSASQIGDTAEVFEHAGGRTVIDEDEIRDSGATSVGEALRGVPGVKVVDASGTGGTDTKLNVSVRGLNPRLSSRSTILLDEVPLAVAPYGQPQMSLFPLSLFNIHAIDVIRGGSAIRFGPQNVGGVINLRTRPVPETLTAAGIAQIDNYGDTLLGIQIGGSTPHFGASVEYTPRFGESYRRESRKEVHGGIIKLEANPVEQVKFTSTTHLYYEESEIPGGLTPEQFAEDRRQSARPLDGFSGRRVGSSLDLVIQPLSELQFQVLGFGTWSYREFRFADEAEPLSTTLDFFPRDYQVLGVEPRMAYRLRTGPVTQDIDVGYRRVFETAHYDRTGMDRYSGVLTDKADDDAQVAADAFYVSDEVKFWDDRLRITTGLRIEDVRMARRDNLRQTLLETHYTAALPSAAVYLSPVYEFAVFMNYSRSFGSPQYMQLVLAGAERQLQPEIADTVEGGVRVRELGGFDAELTGFHMRFANQIEFDDTTFENIGETWHTGVEASLYFWPGYYSEALDGLEMEVGETLLFTQVEAGLYAGNELPYAPRHSVWWDLSYELPAGLKLGLDGWWESEQFSDARNTGVQSANGGYGLIPAFMVWNLRASWEIEVNEHWSLDLKGGVKNLFNEDYWYRSEDINVGILPSRARTFHMSAGIRWLL